MNEIESELLAEVERHNRLMHERNKRLQKKVESLEAEIERLREHHEVAVDWWMQEAQSVKPLTEEVERLHKKVEAKNAAIKTVQIQRDEREEYWRDWNGRAANRAALLEAANKRLRNLLKDALRHVEDAGDDTLAAIIDTQIGSDSNA